jgi:hypothetical protein
VVGQRQHRHLLLRHPLRHLADAAQPVEHAELEVDVEMHKSSVWFGSLDHGQDVDRSLTFVIPRADN